MVSFFQNWIVPHYIYRKSDSHVLNVMERRFTQSSPIVLEGPSPFWKLSACSFPDECEKNQIPETLLCFVCPLHRSPPSASSLFIFPKGPVTGDIQMCLFHLLTFRDGLVVGVFSVLLRSLTPVAIQRGGRRSLTQHLLPLLLLLAVFISLLIRVTLCSFRRSKHTHAF